MNQLNAMNFGKTVKVKAPVSNTIKEQINDQAKAKEKTSTPKVVMAGLATLGVIAAAAVAIKKGKAPKDIKMSVNSFKEAGNTFVKGRAVSANGKPFSGVLTMVNKNGNTREIKYVNGVLQQVEVFKPVNLPNNTDSAVKGALKIPSEKKVFNYIYTDKHLKLDTIDKYGYGHVNSINPKQNGMQYIKTETVNLDAKRADGLKKYADKQAALKAARIKEIGKFGADEKVVNGGTIEYFKDGKRVAMEEIGIELDTYSLAHLGPHDLQVKGKGIRYKEVKTTIFKKDGTCEYLTERLYNTGEKDVLLSGSFGESNSYIKQLDKNGNVKGYLKTSYLSEDSRHFSVHGMQDVTDNVRVELFDANKKLVKSYNTCVDWTDYSKYDWD